MKNNLIIALLFPLLALAQNPGYLGKRSVLAYGVEVSPALENATGAIPFNLTHQLNFDHSIKTNRSIGLAIRYASTIYDNKKEISVFGKPTSDYEIRNVSFMPFIKFYSASSVAPWGKYTMIGAVVNATMTKHDSYMYLTKTVSDHDTLLMDFGAEKQMHTSFDIMIGKGKSRVIKDKILIDYGFNFQLISLLNWITKNGTTLTQENYIERTAIDRVRGLNRFNLYIKIGYLF